MLLSWTYGITDDTAQALPSSKYRIHLFFGAFSVFRNTVFQISSGRGRLAVHSAQLHMLNDFFMKTSF